MLLNLGVFSLTPKILFFSNFTLEKKNFAKSKIRKNFYQKIVLSEISADPKNFRIFINLH